MNTYTVVISNQAKEDISNIYDYILNVLKSNINADAVLNRLYSAMTDLSFMADSYRFYPKEPWKTKGLRYFFVGNYAVFYHVKQNIATIIHVCYGKRDLDDALTEIKMKDKNDC